MDAKEQIKEIVEIWAERIYKNHNTTCHDSNYNKYKWGEIGNMIKDDYRVTARDLLLSQPNLYVKVEERITPNPYRNDQSAAAWDLAQTALINDGYQPVISVSTLLKEDK